MLGLAVTVYGCGMLRPGVPIATDEPFPAPFVDTGEWGSIGISLDTGTTRVPTLDGLIRQIDGFLRAGIRAPRTGSGVTITVPEGAQTAREAHLFVTVVGGATDLSSGMQFRLVVFRDDKGWWLDPTGEARIYCDEPLTGVYGTSCH